MAAVPDPDSPEVVYQLMRWNTPLSEDHAELLLNHLDEAAGWELLDLGCGWGEFLSRAVARAPQAHGTGVDNADWAVERGRRAAAERGLSRRLRFVVGDSTGWSDPADRLVCIGASHAWRGCAKALKELRRLVRPGGRLLFGDGYWDEPPTPAATALFGENVVGLDSLMSEAIQAGWRVLYLSTADQREWDDFESAWRGGCERWLQMYPLDRRSDAVKAKLNDRLHEYIAVYRNVLGFAYLVLAPA